MWGPGVKRKLDQDQDGAEDEEAAGGREGPDARAPPAGPAPGGFCSRASYALQRQMVLNISLVKLYRQPVGRGDPGLQRRILISNVIRRIHDDLRGEGGVRALFFALPAAGVARRDREERGPATTAATPPPPSPPPPFGLSPLDSCLTPASLLEEDPPPFFALPSSPSPSPHPLLPQCSHHDQHPLRLAAAAAPPSPAPKDSFSSALEEIEELDSSSSADSAPPPPPPPSPPPPPLEPMQTSPPAAERPGQEGDMDVEAEVEDEEEEEGEGEEESRLVEYRPASPPRCPALAQPPVVPSGGFLTDFAMDDVLFTDIDTSMYDFGPCGPHPAGAGPGGVGGSTGPSKMAADDLVVRAISGYSGGGGGPGGHQNQPFRMDLAELDHIMEVLVGS